MNGKKIVTTLLIAIFAIFAVASTSLAGDAHHYRMEGLAWGIGAAILGKVLLDQHRNQYGTAAPAPQPAVIENHYYQSPPEPAGHWETSRQWVPPTYKNVWNPGHYNRGGHWMRGHWIQMEDQPGYWQERNVWVPHY
jgi:hypothetical protein